VSSEEVCYFYTRVQHFEYYFVANSQNQKAVHYCYVVANLIQRMASQSHVHINMEILMRVPPRPCCAGYSTQLLKMA